MTFLDFVKRLRDWLAPKPEIGTTDKQDRSSLADLARLLKEDEDNRRL